MMNKDQIALQIAGWKVLVVDEEPDRLDMAMRVLKFYGAGVYLACNGREALDIIARITPTFILADLSMPVMDGWELLHHVKGNPRTRPIPVIALTAHAMPGDRERALEVGFDHYLTKPLNPFTLLRDLLNLLVDTETGPAAG